MITYCKGTVFNAGAEAIVNTINCDGVMGAGIALEFGLRYPEMHKNYIEKCKNNEIMVGKVDFYKDNTGPLIINFPTKWHFKYPSRIQWIENGLKDFADKIGGYNVQTVAFPKLGTNKGGLSWDEVKPMMEQYLSDLGVDVVICLDEEREAQGIELNMLSAFNNESMDSIVRVVRLNEKQRNAIIKSRPYSRFWLIGKTEGIGKTTYEKLFRHYYDKAISKDSKGEQLTFKF